MLSYSCKNVNKQKAACYYYFINMLALRNKSAKLVLNNATCSFSKYRTYCSKPEPQQINTNDSAACSVVVEKDTNITLIGINRETYRNAIDSKTALQLNQAIENFENDADSPVAVLYGIGGSFCAGSDLIEMQQQTENGNWNFLTQTAGSVGPTRRHIHKPLVCGINGYCVGAGLELALMCDLRVMEDTAVLGCFNRYLGVPLTDAGTVRLAAAVGLSRAMDLMATGRKVYAKEALAIGLINRLVATGTSLGQAVNLAFSFAKFPMASLMHDRNCLITAFYERRKGFKAAINNEIMCSTEQMAKEMKEGAARFKSSKIKGPTTNAWNVKEKQNIADWELKEIAFEAENNKDS